MYKHIFALITVLVLSVFTILPLFYSGFFPMHDDTQVARVYEMKKSLSDGMFPVRWVADLGYGYGYPIFNFYAPLAYYFGGFVNLLGLDSLSATKVMIGFGILLSGVTMYMLTRVFFGIIGAVVASLFYMYAPYHALNIYVRGDVAEFWAYAFIPLCFYGIWMVYKTQQWKYLIAASLGYAGVILSHNLSALMISPFLFSGVLLLSYSAYKKKKMKTVALLFVSFFLGIFLAAFYWLPVGFEMQYTNVLSQIGGGSDFRDHFVCPSQLWNSLWGYAGSAPGCIDGLSFKIGKLHVILSVLSFVLLPLVRQKREIFFVMIFSVVSLVFSVFLTLQVSQILWETIPLMKFFQFPWRFLLVISFFISFTVGFVFWYIQTSLPAYTSGKRLVIPGAIIVIIGLILLNAKLFVPLTYLPRTEKDYTNEYMLTWETTRSSDEYLPPEFQEPKKPEDIKRNLFTTTSLAHVSEIKETTDEISAKITAEKINQIVIHIAYFPAWKVYIDNALVDYKVYNNTLLVWIPEGTHTIKAVFVQTPVEKIANILSLISVFILLAGIIYKKKRVTT